MRTVQTAFLICTLSACTMTETTVQQPQLSKNDEVTQQFQQLGGNALSPSVNSGKRESKNINHYVRGMMHQLVENMQHVNNTTPLGVASFVHLDSDLQKTDIFGQQLAESFIHEVHKFGIPVLDYKTTDYFRVSPSGDFVFTRDFMELSNEVPVRYVLTGTMTKHANGYLVNARIIGIQSKVVVASAQQLVPEYVVRQLQSMHTLDGVPLHKSS